MSMRQCSRCGAKIHDGEPLVQQDAETYWCESCCQEDEYGEADRIHDGKVECLICGELYEPDPEKVRLWAESGDAFDGTDWTCPACVAWEDMRSLDGDDDEPEQPDAPPCDQCGFSFEPSPGSDMHPDCMACLDWPEDDEREEA